VQWCSGMVKSRNVLVAVGLSTNRILPGKCLTSPRELVAMNHGNAVTTALFASTDHNRLPMLDLAFHAFTVETYPQRSLNKGVIAVTPSSTAFWMCNPFFRRVKYIVLG